MSSNGRILVGISGGADSICLLELLRIISPKFNLELYAIHINHLLRKNAQRDEDFVKRVCQQRKIKLKVVRVDVKSYAQRHKLSIEESARCLRYHHYQLTAKRLKCTAVALGHNADDNLETVLINLSRGTGLRGISGIPVRRGVFIRPLLKINRLAIRQFLHARGIEWIEDESNEDINFTRNLIRQRIVPVLKQINPSICETVLRTGELLRAEDRFLNSLAQKILDKMNVEIHNHVSIDINKLNSYNIILRRRLVRLIAPELDAGGVEKLIDLSERGCLGSHQLRAKITALITKEKLVLRRGGRVFTKKCLI